MRAFEPEPRPRTSVRPRKRVIALAVAACAAVSAAFALLDSPAAAEPAFGILQFKTEHNLATPACLAIK